MLYYKLQAFLKIAQSTFRGFFCQAEGRVLSALLFVLFSGASLDMGVDGMASLLIKGLVVPGGVLIGFVGLLIIAGFVLEEVMPPLLGPRLSEVLREQDEIFNSTLRTIRREQQRIQQHLNDKPSNS